MFSDYALMAGGHDVRPSKKERVRQRFMHKLRYFPERYNELMCVGCGRCLAKCPVNVDITRIIGQIKEAEVNGG
jgi:NAD-dependent dihydropyrimidine dehydrogenase PreA subunit